MSKSGMTQDTAERIRIEKGGAEPSRLRAVRIAKGLSQTELAEKSGLSKATVQIFEQQPKRVNTARLNTLCILCAALECQISDIVEGEEFIKQYNEVK